MVPQRVVDPVMRGQGRVGQRTYRDKRTGEVKAAATDTVQ
jgi:hypothetical protein